LNFKLNNQHLLLIGWSLFWSRFMSITSLIVFSYFVGPEPFAPFGVYATIIVILWIVVFGCYEQAILVCEADELNSLVRLCQTIAAVAIGAVSLLCVMTMAASPAFLNAVDGLYKVIPFIPLTLLARAVHRLMSHLATRDGLFDLVASLNWMQASVQAATLLVLLTLDWPGIICLVMAELVGLVVVTFYCLRTYPQFRQVMLAKTVPAGMRACARKWIAMPTWRLLMSLTSVVALGLPSFVIPLHYSAAIAGQILFAMRMLDVPSNVISGAVSPILQGNLMSPARSRQTAKREVWLTAGISTAVFAMLGIVAYFLQPYFEGTAWALAIGAFLPLTLYYIGLTTSAPFVGAVVGPNVERASALAQIVFLIVNCVVATMVANGLPIQWMLIAFGGAMLLRCAAFAVLYVRQVKPAGQIDQLVLR
jgi:hypothetical protein